MDDRRPDYRTKVAAARTKKWSLKDSDGGRILHLACAVKKMGSTDFPRRRLRRDSNRGPSPSRSRRNPSEGFVVESLASGFVSKR